MSTLITRARLAVAAVAFAAVAAGGVAGAAGSKPSSTSFDLFPNTPFLNCLAAPGKTPVAKVQVTRGKLNDQLELNVRNLKPDLDFDLFTVEKTPQLADGSAEPELRRELRLRLVPVRPAHQPRRQGPGHDQDDPARPDLRLRRQPWCPTGEHLQRRLLVQQPGRRRAAAASPAFTPFNGEHQAGPLAMISRLNATTNLGPLCTDPESASNGTFTCNP